MNTVLRLWHELPWIIREPINLFIYVVFIRGMLGSEIGAWLKEKGIFKDGIIHTTIRFFKRHLAIWLHYWRQHQGEVLGCGKDNCSIFGI